MQIADLIPPIDVFLKQSFRLRLGITVCVCLLWISTGKAFAQINTSARYEIDAKRIGVDPASKDALPRSREFIRLDSTYYVGWMYEGLYKYERSGDYLGYQQAIVPLHKALRLIEKDYGLNIRNIFSSMSYFTENNSRFNDFFNIVNTLELSYNSIELPDSTMALFQKIEGYGFQRDFFYTGCGKAWLYHRNRFYTSDKYPFLKNSIKENEAMAFKECYRQIDFIYKNKAINDRWYGNEQSEDDLLTVYHYLALLHDYNKNYDSSRYYHEILVSADRISWSNYANMQHVAGDFSEAMVNYSRPQYKRKFSLSESDYYMPMILVYGGYTKQAIQLAQTKINESGSTPGFGWYNIALARGYLYDGQLDSCEFFLNKAANFKELHINTTLTQSQYEFTINLLRIQVIKKKIALIKFCNSGWWYSLTDLLDIYSLKSVNVLLEYALVNAMANNPERDRLVYDLFCSEATVSFDESMYLLEDFCLPYFEKKYNDYATTDSRKKIIRYFRLFALRFMLEEGEESEVYKNGKLLFLETIPSDESEQMNDNKIDENYEKLYKFRLLELLTRSNDESKAYNDYRNQCYETYPQLMLFSGIPVDFSISFSGLENDAVIKDIKNDLEDCDINFTKNAAFHAELQFYKKGDTYQAIINVYNTIDNKLIVSDEAILFKEKESIGKEIAMRLFGKGGATKVEKAIN